MRSMLLRLLLPLLLLLPSTTTTTAITQWLLLLLLLLLVTHAAPTPAVLSRIYDRECAFARHAAAAVAVTVALHSICSACAVFERSRLKREHARVG